MSGDPVDSGGESPRPTALRLVWSNPCPPPPPRPVDLATAIEGHLAGRDGLTDEQFVKVYARGGAPRRGGPMPRPLW